MRNPRVILCVGEGRPRKEHSLPVLTDTHGHDVTGFRTPQRVALLLQAAPSTHVARKTEF